MRPVWPIARELVLIGGGHAHALVLRRWGMDPLPGVRVTVIDPAAAAPYTGMLPGHVAGHYAQRELEIDLGQLARFAGARLILGRAEGLDRTARRIHVAGRPGIPYDVASLDIGIGSAPRAVPGFADYGVAAKPLGIYAARWASFRAAVADGMPPEIVVIGGGVGGVELAMAMAHALRRDGHVPEVTVLDRGPVLAALGPRARAALIAAARAEGVEFREHASIAAVTETAVLLADGGTLPARFVTGVAGARPQTWLAETGLDLTDGFVTVTAELRSVTDPAIYAAGDIAHLSPAPRPKAGVFAVRAAAILHHNLRADLSGRPRRQFRPQRDYLKLISLGGQSALMEKWGITLSGPWLWRLKDRIDRKFMNKFENLPVMAPPVPPGKAARGLRDALGDKPACGGCGAKVGGSALAGVLAALPRGTRADVLTQPGDDAAVLSMGGTRQVITTDHLRAFTADPWTMTRIAAVHALGDVWAMGATPQAALAQVILPRLAPALQQSWLAEIMDAAGTVFAAAGAEIVGGHSSVGAELTVGFTVTGLCDRAPITLAGAQPGDALILTKPIGSGTLLAAEMQGLADGRWVAAALAQMTVPQGAASRVLSGAHAMTDVTGFGLAGHLLAICDASGVAAELNLSAIPFLTGAVELAARGVRSTLYPENLAQAARVQTPGGPKSDLLFDPQTAGGLLAAVPQRAVSGVLARLTDQDVPGVCIGQIRAGTPALKVH